MNIIKNWFHKLSEIIPSLIKDTGKNLTIKIANDLVVTIFDDINNNLEIELWENSKVDFFSLLENIDDTTTKFIQNKKNSVLKVNCLLLSRDSKNIKTKFYSKLSANFVKSDVHIISMVWNNWFIDIDWVIEIVEWVKKVEWYLNEENLFLWSTWKIKWIPTLLVASDDVKASHACKMERIIDDKLFYLRSRWLSKDNALSMMIEAQIKNLFVWLSVLDNNFYEELLENIILKIK